MQMRSVKILVIENDKNSRKVIISALKSIDFVKVVGYSSSCLGAFRFIDANSPDIIFLDYEMPQIDIKHTIDRIKKIKASAEIILVSKTRRTSSTSSIRALKLGALLFIKKPSDNTNAENVQYFGKYLQPIIRQIVISQKKEFANQAAEKIVRPETKQSIPPACKNESIFEILAIGCSLGGPDALKQIIPALPADFPIPIVITQHMPEDFTERLASDLDFRSRLIVMEGRNGITIQPGYVYIAPGGKHMKIKEVELGLSKRLIILLDNGPLVHNCRPAVDVMFNSLATNLSGNILTVILTGMGHDGLVGIRALKIRRKCYCITQDQRSSVVYGMPGAVAKAGLSDLSLPLSSIASRINHIVCGSVQTVNSL